MNTNPTTPIDEDEAYPRYLAALLAGDRRQCREEFERWLASSFDLRVIYHDLVQRSLHDVGRLWEQGQISVATEHLATAITESLLNLVYPRLFSQPRLGRSAVVSCVANEYHQIGGKMVADIFELNGWRGHFFGANRPLQELLDVIQEKRPDVVALSATVYPGLEVLFNAAAEIQHRFPSVPILVGGQAFQWGGRERAAQTPGVRYLADLAALESWIKSYAN